MTLSRIRMTPLRAADGAGSGAGGGSAAAAALTDSAAAAAAPPAGEPGAPAAAAAAPPAGGGSPWWQALPDAEREHLAAKGLNIDDPAQAASRLVQANRHLESRLRLPADRILERPADGQSAAEWLAANRAALGLPDKPEAYAVEAPDGWPQGIPWDSEFEGAAREIAMQHAVPPEVHRAYVAAYADKMKAIDEAATAGLAQAQEEMATALRLEWKDNYDRNVAMAQQAVSVMGERAGLSGDALQLAVQAVSGKTGDAAAMRLFAAIGDAMGEDSGVGIGAGGRGSLAPTPEAARAELQAFTKLGGDWDKAVRDNNQAELARLRPIYARLTKAAAG